MLIGPVTLELQRTGPHAKLVLQAKPFGHDVPITFDELDHFIRELTDAAATWRRERNTVSPEWYVVLGVPRSAFADEIQAAYRRLARRYHPDTSASDSTAAMQQLNEAYDVLSDLVKRQQYDATL